jgi:trans-2,3-dihydro-3-hydroxyanthranilate isomerase
MNAARQLPLVQVDVFSSQPLEGNQLAVFTDARALSAAEMQALARETNLMETTFVLPREGTRPLDPIPVRIFTVKEELPFAGHPTLGTAAVLRGESGVKEIRLELGIGVVPVSFEDTPKGAFGEMRQRDPEFGALHDRDSVARAAGLDGADIAHDVPIQTVSTGLPFTIVPVRKLATLQGLRLHWARAQEYLERTDGKFFYFVSRETVDSSARLHARMIFYNGEDPATGSAAGCCAAWAAKYGIVASGERAMIEQGLECLRPSHIYISAETSAGRITNVRVGGHTAIVMRGQVLI